MEPLHKGNEAEVRLEQQARQIVRCLDALFFLRKPSAPESEVEMTPQEVRAIVVLGHDGRSIMSGFAKAMAVPLSTATHMVNRLVKKELVIRVRGKADRRIVYVQLSKEGTKVEQMFLERRVSVGREMLSPLSPGERESLLELLGKMSDSSNRECRSPAE